jgi:exonuclease III
VAKQVDVKHVIDLYKPDIICIQETKISFFDTSLIRNSLGSDFENNSVYLPAKGTRGGIILTVMASIMQLSNPVLTSHTISAIVTNLIIRKSWMLTGVYGPQGDLEKKKFIWELKQLKQSAKPEWVLLGDFNLISDVQDKNNGRLDRGMMLRFRRAINHLAVKEIKLVGRKYTWSNNHQIPTLTRIGRVYCTAKWE